MHLSIAPQALSGSVVGPPTSVNSGAKHNRAGLLDELLTRAKKRQRGFGTLVLDPSGKYSRYSRVFVDNTSTWLFAVGKGGSSFSGTTSFAIRSVLWLEFARLCAFF